MAKGGYRGGMPMGGRNQMQMMKQAQLPLQGLPGQTARFSQNVPAAAAGRYVQELRGLSFRFPSFSREFCLFLRIPQKQGRKGNCPFGPG